MRILLVHQNFPGQFRDIAPSLCDRGHDLKAISCSQRPNDQRIQILRYEHEIGERDGVHQQTLEVDDWIRRGEHVAKQATKLKEDGWAPDAMLAHPGWGEAILLKEIFPSTPLIIWPELWIRSEHLGHERQQTTVDQLLYVRIKNWLIDGAMSDASVAILPTKYQAETFPQKWQDKITVLHEGINKKLFENKPLDELKLSDEITLKKDLPVVTYISRNLEPMRGFPTFMRALPQLLKHNKEVHIVIVGGDEVSYSNAPNNGKTWKQVILEELEGELDMKRVHMYGRVPHDQLQKLYLRSNLHVYLSKAFVLSWSLLEIMACETPVLAEANPMMEELIEPDKNGTLWKEGHISLGETMIELLESPEKLHQWGKAAKKKVREEYSQTNCINKLEDILKNQAMHF